MALNQKYSGYCICGPLYGKDWQAIYHAAQCMITFGTMTKRNLDDDDNWEVLGECCHTPPTSPAPTIPPFAIRF